MDNGQGLVVNLSSGRLGSDTANVMGGLILSAIAQAGYSRADLPASQHRPFFVSVDEAPSFTTTAMASMLPRLRKFGVGLTMVAQYVDQLDPDLLAAILGNVGSILAFRTGAGDARVIAEHLGEVLPRDLVSQPNFSATARVMIAGEPSPAFSMSVKGPSVGDPTGAAAWQKS